MECSILECNSEAVARSTISGSVYCNECALQVMKENGPDSLVTLADKGEFPWEHPADGKCQYCGVSYNKFLIGRGNECPKCRKDL